MPSKKIVWAFTPPLYQPPAKGRVKNEKERCRDQIVALTSTACAPKKKP